MFAAKNRMLQSFVTAFRSAIKQAAKMVILYLANLGKARRQQLTAGTGIKTQHTPELMIDKPHTTPLEPR